MTLSDETRRALYAYDSFTDFVRCPDLPWSPEAYERLDDEVAETMLRAFCFAWAASQQAAGTYCGSVADLSDALFEALPSWDASLDHNCKIEWTLRLGVTSVLFQLDSRPATASPGDPPAQHNGMSHADKEAVDDMAHFFRIEPQQASLLFQIGRALSRASPSFEAEVGALATT